MLKFGLVEHCTLTSLTFELARSLASLKSAPRESQFSKAKFKHGSGDPQLEYVWRSNMYFGLGWGGLEDYLSLFIK